MQNLQHLNLSWCDTSMPLGSPHLYISPAKQLLGPNGLNGARRHLLSSARRLA